MFGLKDKIKLLLDKKITKKIFLAVVISVFVASFLAVLGNSQARHKIKLAYYGFRTEEHEMEFKTEDLTSVGYDITDNANFEATTNDPQIFLGSINEYVDDITVYFNKNVSQVINVEVFYATEKKGICAEQMLAYTVNAGENKARFYVGKSVTDIRLDLGTSQGVSFKLDTIKINDGLKNGVIETIIRSYAECLHTHIFWDRLQIYFLICMFISLNIILDIKSLY